MAEFRGENPKLGLGPPSGRAFVMRNDAELTPTRDNSFGDFRSDNQSSMGKLPPGTLQ